AEDHVHHFAVAVQHRRPHLEAQPAVGLLQHSAEPAPEIVVTRQESGQTDLLHHRAGRGVIAAAGEERQTGEEGNRLLRAHDRSSFQQGEAHDWVESAPTSASATVLSAWAPKRPRIVTGRLSSLSFWARNPRPSISHAPAIS